MTSTTRKGDMSTKRDSRKYQLVYSQYNTATKASIPSIVPII